jgi:cytochrome c-type biogenesis protein CcmE
MSAIQKKLCLAGTGLVLAVCYLTYAGIKSGWVYFVDVDQFVADSRYHTQRLRLHGRVAVERFSSESLDARFVLLGQARQLNVVYHGVIPDQFQPGRDVVVEGKLDSAGIFRADVMMTKCASKYEPASPHQSAKEPA